MEDDRWDDFTNEELEELREGARRLVMDGSPPMVGPGALAGDLMVELDRVLMERRRSSPSSRVRVQVQVAADGLMITNVGEAPLKVLRGPSPSSPEADGVRVSPGGHLRVPAYSIVIEPVEER